MIMFSYYDTLRIPFQNPAENRSENIDSLSLPANYHIGSFITKNKPQKWKMLKGGGGG